jgi:hypothetical protein
MLDALFKNLSHNAGGYKIISQGQEIDKGYKPDVVLKNEDGYIIMECDTSTTRKGYIGGMVKAAKYLSGDKKGIAVFVIKEKANTKVRQIYAHLIPYFEWIMPLTNLQAVYLISTDAYCPIDRPVVLLGTDFIEQAKAILRVGARI